MPLFLPDHVASLLKVLHRVSIPLGLRPSVPCGCSILSALTAQPSWSWPWSPSVFDFLPFRNLQSSSSGLVPISFSFPWASLVAQDSEESTCSVGDLGSIPGSERSPGAGNGYPHWYFCLEDPRVRGAWRAAVHRVSESDTTELLSTHRGRYIRKYIFVFPRLSLKL